VTTTAHLRTMFGVKLARLREAKRLTLSALAGRAGVSTSYLAEIEAGKKYPKAEKILGLAEALDTTFDELVSSRVDPEYAPLKGFLEAPGLRDFPFERFGLPREQLVHLLSRSPTEVAALLRTLNDVARQYNIGVEHFLHAALRSYQELTGNYYPDLELAAEQFVDAILPRAGSRPPLQGAPLAEALERWVRGELGVRVDTEALGREPSLRHVRAVRLAEGSPRLLLNPELTPSQRAFALAREIGYQRLGLKARSDVSPPNAESSFDQVLNDFKSSYFAGAVVMPRRTVLADLKRLFRQPRWHAESLLGLLDRYEVTAETLMYRLSQVAPGELGLKVHFLKFRDDNGDFRLVKQLNLSELPIPPGHGGGEHYCRRWLTTRLLTDLAASQHRHPKRQPGPLIGVQVSRFIDGSDDYFCLGLSLPASLEPDVNISLTIGFRADERFQKTVRFAKDRSIPRTLISTTCERCPLEPSACRDRVAPPHLYLHHRIRAEQTQALAALRSS